MACNYKYYTFDLMSGKIFTYRSKTNKLPPLQPILLLSGNRMGCSTTTILLFMLSVLLKGHVDVAANAA